jgi:hypothetical protein
MFKTIENAIKSFIAMFTREEKKISVQTAKMPNLNEEIETVQNAVKEIKEAPDYPVTFVQKPTAPEFKVTPVTVYSDQGGVTAEIENNISDVNRTVRFTIGDDGVSKTDNLEVIESNNKAERSSILQRSVEETSITMEVRNTKTLNSAELITSNKNIICKNGQETIESIDFTKGNMSYYSEHDVSQFQMDDLTVMNSNVLIDESYGSKSHHLEANEVSENYDDGTVYYCMNSSDVVSTLTKTAGKDYTREVSIDDDSYIEYVEETNYESTNSKHKEHRVSSEFIIDYYDSTVTKRNETETTTETKSKQTHEFIAEETVESDNYFALTTEERREETTSSKTTEYSAYSSNVYYNGTTISESWEQQETTTRKSKIFMFETSSSYEDDETFVYQEEKYSIESTNKKSVETWYIDNLEVNSEYYRDYNEEIESITYANGEYNYTNHRTVGFSSDDFSFWIEVYDNDSSKYGSMSSLHTYFEGDENSVYYDLYQQELISISNSSDTLIAE